jgi:hypothetical protein
MRVCHPRPSPSSNPPKLEESANNGNPPDHITYVPGLVAASILFVLFILLVVCFYFLGTGLRRRPAGLGFGLDGFTEDELKATKLKE